MALANKHPDEIKDALGAWLAGRLPDATDVTVDELDVPAASGMSNLTVLFTASWTQDCSTTSKQYVVRVAPEGPAVFMRYDLGKEASVMRALHGLGHPVPRVQW